MSYNFSYIHVIILLLAGLAAFIFAGLLFLKKHVPAAKYLALVFVSAGIWIMAGGVEAAALTAAGKIFWAKVGYIGLVNVMPFIFVFVLMYFRKDQRLFSKKIGLLWLVPLIVLICVWTNQYHGWIWSGYSPIRSDFNVMSYEYGWMFWVYAPYMIILVFASLMVLLREYFIYQYSSYRIQIILMVAAILIPLIVSLVYLNDKYTTIGLNWILLSVFFSTVMVAFSVLRFGFIDLLPIARDLLVESMDNGVLVTDQRNRIVDYNQRCADLFSIKTNDLFGKDVCPFLKEHGLNDKLLLEEKLWREEILLNQTNTKYLEVIGRPIFRSSQNFEGWLLLINDITILKQKENEVQEINRKLMVQLSETERLKNILEEQAVRDPLTGLYNRRYLEVTLEREISRAIRNIHFVAFLMLDIDYFKSINNQYGLNVGDQVLCVMAEMLTQHSRKEDVACRFGGAEFFLLLPNISIQAAYDRAEEIRLSFIQRCHDLSHSVDVTVSIGVAIYPQHADTGLGLLRKADQALYAAKQAGRNQVCLATENGMDE